MSDNPDGFYSDQMVSGYRQLSLLAVASLALGSVTALVMGFGFAIALFRDVSFLLPTGYMGLGFVPLAGLLCGWVAIRTIAGSQGAMSGRNLAWIGLLLSGGSMMLYGAYHGATVLALRIRSEGFVNEWMALIASQDPEKIDRAFVFTLPPGSRPSLEGDRADVRAKLEVDHNRPNDLTSTGLYTAFLSSPLVQLLSEVDANAQWRLKSVTEPEYIDNGYLVGLEFEVTTSEARFKLGARLHGSMANLPPLKKWQIREHQITSSVGRGSPDLEPAGKARALRVEMARRAGAEFIDAMDPKKRNFPRAYSLTIPGSRIPLVKPDNPAMALYFRTMDGSSSPCLIEAKLPVFWCSEDVRKEFFTYFKAAWDIDFAGPPFPWISIQQAPLAPSTVRDGRIAVRLPVKIMMLPRYTGLAELVMSAPVDRADSKEAWLVEKLVMVSARLSPPMPELEKAPPEAMNMLLQKQKPR